MANFFARRLRRVGRVYIAPSDKGLASYNALNDAVLYLYYDAENKIFFVGSFKHPYPAYYTNNSDKAAKFAARTLLGHLSGVPFLEDIITSNKEVIDA